MFRLADPKREELHSPMTFNRRHEVLLYFEKFDLVLIFSMKYCFNKRSIHVPFYYFILLHITISNYSPSSKRRFHTIHSPTLTKYLH